MLIMVEPILQLNLIPSVKAQEANSNTDSDETAPPSAYDGNSTSTQPESINSSAYMIPLKAKSTAAETENIILTLADLHSEEDRTAGIGLDEALSNQTEPRIILNGDDQQALKILWRLSGTWMMPDFEREPEAIWEQYPKFEKKLISEKKSVYDDIVTTLGHKIDSVEDISAIKVASNAHYLDLTHYAQIEWQESLGDVAAKVKELTDNAFKANPPTAPTANVLEMISDVTSGTVAEINQIFLDHAKTNDPDLVASTEQQYKDLMDDFTENIEAVKIDIRIINLLVYLVTPKTQGGAGHYKIKVKRILSGYTAPKKIFSRESETIYNSGDPTAATTVNPTTAAEYGQNRGSAEGTNQQPLSNINPSTNALALFNSDAKNTNTGQQSLSDEDPDADAVVSDHDGESYNAFVTSASAADAADEETGVERNVSAHADGQAVDISEVDDIRCTLIKKRRVGGYQRSKFVQRPIKLAWQTEKGYSENGGGDLYKADMANVLKSFSSDSIKELISEFGGDLSDYDGDLSSAGFSEIAMLIGKSIFSQIINSPGANLHGYQFGDTLTQLGGMYMADYLGLPREMFAQGSIPDSYEEMTQRIGTAAIEKRLDLPIGTFGGNDLWGMLSKVGQRKLEFEMNLTTGALDGYFRDTATSTLNVENKDYLIGKAIIEQELNLAKGSYSGPNNTKPRNFAELTASLGKIKSGLAFRDDVYSDNLLHINLGSTEKLVKSDPSMSPFDYAVLVGRTRLDDTAYGLQYMAAKDASYELEEGTFKLAIDGDASALVTIGLRNMARVFTTGDDERRAFTQWVQANLAVMGPDLDSCSYEEPVKVVLDAGAPTAKEVTLSDEKATAVGLNSGEMFAMFACPQSNPSAVFQSVGSKILRDALVQYYLTPEEKVKFNIDEVNPVFHSSDAEKQFYVTRAYDILTILDRIKNNWNAGNKDPEYQRVKAVIDEGYNSIKAILDTSMPITTVDQAKKAGRSLAVSINKLKADVSGMRYGANRYINKINGTIIDIDTLVRTVSEIISGKIIPSSDTISIKDIPANAYTESPDSTVNAPALNNDLTPRVSNDSLVGLVANRQSFMALLARKMKPADFFLIMAADKIEVALSLPQNSLIYFVQNYEKKGLGTVDSFYSAIGQAKIEETFNMPAKYFQGSFISDIALDAPDFRTDLRMLYLYGDADIEAIAPPPITVANAKNSFKAYALDNITLTPGSTLNNPYQNNAETTADTFNFFNDDGTLPSELSEEQQEIVKEEHYINELSWIRLTDSETFNYLVQRAEGRYRDQIQAFINSLSITNRDLEVMIGDVTENVRLHGLNDKIRTAEQDLLFRMGFSGSLDALTSGSSVAWIDAGTRANQIDNLLNLPLGSTKSLFTGERIDSGSGLDRLSTKDKQILVAKMGISPVAIDKLLRFLSGELPLSELEATANDVTNIGDNPYLGSSSDTCDTSALTQVDGVLAAGSLVKNNWFYFDKNIDARAGKTFGSQSGAENYALEHKNDQVSYIDELAYGLSRLSGITAERLKPQIESFLRGESETALNLSGDGPARLEESMGVSQGALEKLFVKTEATSVDVPLVTYKRAVGRQVVKRTINSKIFGALGLRIDPSLFGGNEFFEIMQGNYTSLWGIAGAVVDQTLNIPRGSTMNILTARTADLRRCAVAEIGGAIVGKFVGLDYVSLKGNIYQNIGRSRLEKSLGLPKNSFAGENIEQLINNVGVVNFYIAFKYPTGNIDLNASLRAFYDPTYVESIISYSNDFKIKKIKEYLDFNSALSLSGVRQDAYLDLKSKLIERIKTTSVNAIIAHGSDRSADGAWRKGEYGAEKKDDIEAYLDRIDTIDRTFGITVGTTARLVYGAAATVEKTITVACNNELGQDIEDPDGNGHLHWDNGQGLACTDGPPDMIHFNDPDDGSSRSVPAPRYTCDCQDIKEYNPVWEIAYASESQIITPNVYIEKISSKTLLGVAAYSALDLFDFDMSEEQKQAVVGVLTHYGNWSKDNEGAAKIYEGLSTIFSLHLDTKAGLEEGSIKRMIENPGRIGDVLLPQAARRLDRQLGLDPGEKMSLSGIYARYLNSSPDTNTNNETGAQDCGTEQANIDNLEKTIQARQARIDNWTKANGGHIGWAGVDAPRYSGTGTLPGFRIEEQPGYDDMLLEQRNINSDRATLQGLKNTCKAGNRLGNVADQDGRTYTLNRSYLDRAAIRYCSTVALSDANKAMCQDINSGSSVKWKFAWLIITDLASDLISDEIYRLSKNTIRMPAEDIKHFFVNGDMRYFSAALFSYGANTFLNSLSGETDPTPLAWQVSYDMFKLWVIGDSEAETYAANAAAADYFNPDTADIEHEASLAPMGYGDVFNYEYSNNGNGGFFGTFFSQQFDIRSSNSNLGATTVTRDQLITFSNRQSDVISNGGVALDPATVANVDTQMDTLSTQAATCQTELSNLSGIPAEELGPTEQAIISRCDDVSTTLNDVNARMQQARTGTRERFRKQVQYRMMDATLWTKDHNIFPGFSYMLLEGSGKQKNVAIALYLKNGFINGEFFGQKIGFLQTIEAETGMSVGNWMLLVDWGIELAGNKPDSDVLVDFQKSGGLIAVSQFISSHSEKWFGFEIDTEYAQGLMVGITTGKWGLSIGGNGVEKFGGIEFATLGGIFKAKSFDRMLNKAFSWADRQSGWKPGTAYEIFNTGMKIYNAVKRIKKIEQLKKLYANGLDSLESIASFQEANPWANGIKDEAGCDAAKMEQLKIGIDIAAKYVTDAAMRWINAQAGQDIAEFETKYSLVPGSTSMLIEEVVGWGAYNACVFVYNQVLAGSMANMSYLGPAALYMALAMFVAVNLFGYYGTELKCSADGYYPEIESPSMATDSSSELGIWDGQNEEEAKAKTIGSAQYKAKRLILDALEMHKNPLYKDVYPSQIMTGRDADVLSINDSITENMCSALGLISVAGICGGNTQAGVWENLQTTTYTHIGF